MGINDEYFFSNPPSPAVSCSYYYYDTIMDFIDQVLGPSCLEHRLGITTWCKKLLKCSDEMMKAYSQKGTMIL